ncbi:MAG: hypothetical protein ABS69_06350 [Nitrosomonadales bacterium SCN 54-20]|nr:MAG: hypothetical protein ABS69_06350 [Nitrosomonadales bacterium SCN 54-20]
MKCRSGQKAHEAVFRTMASASLEICREKIKKNDVFTDTQIAFSKKAEQIATVPTTCKPRHAGRACRIRVMIIPTLPRMLKEDLSNGF